MTPPFAWRASTVNLVSSNIIDPRLTADGLGLIYAITGADGVRKIYVSRRATVAEDFGDGVRVEGLPPADDSAPWLSADGRVLLFANKLGYQTRSFDEAARKVCVELVFVTDRCHQLEDPWGDRAIPVHFELPEAAAYTVIEAMRATGRSVDGILALGDRPAVAAAYVARGSVYNAHSISATKRMIKQAFTAQLEKRGFSFVEILTMCPTGWFIPVEEGPGYLHDVLGAVHGTGVLRDGELVKTTRELLAEAQLAAPATNR